MEGGWRGKRRRGYNPPPPSSSKESRGVSDEVSASAPEPADGSGDSALGIGSIGAGCVVGPRGGGGLVSDNGNVIPDRSFSVTTAVRADGSRIQISGAISDGSDFWGEGYGPRGTQQEGGFGTHPSNGRGRRRAGALSRGTKQGDCVVKYLRKWVGRERLKQLT